MSDPSLAVSELGVARLESVREYDFTNRSAMKMSELALDDLRSLALTKLTLREIQGIHAPLWS